MQAKLEALTRSYLEQGFFPSAVVSVFTPVETLCRFAVGDARVDTVYDVASLTKIATATQILQLIDAGSLALSDEILDVLPELSESGLLRKRLGGVTIARLLSHASGIVDWYPFYAERGKPFAEVLEIALRRYGPVEGMVYSDLNFMLLGKLIEARTSLSLRDALKENLASKLPAGRMTYTPDNAWDIAPSCYGNPIEERMCAERNITFDGWRPHTPVRGEANDGNAYYYFGGVAGSAGIFADVEAYEQLGRMHMNTESELFLDAQQEHAPTRGLGWQLGDMYPQGCGHTGFTGTSLYISRDLGIGVAAFTNRLFFQQENPNPTNQFRTALHKLVAELATE